MRVGDVAVSASQNYRYGWHDKGVRSTNDSWETGPTERLQQCIDARYKQYCLYHLCFIFLKKSKQEKEK
jgi:hypothetical protein